MPDTPSAPCGPSSGRPFVRLKLAASLDGTTALPDGRSQWITSPAAREDGHRWRARADVLLTGIGTVLADDPRLDVRLPAGDAAMPAAQPRLVVADGRLRTPPGAALFAAARSVEIWCRADASESQAEALRGRGATVHRLPTDVMATARCTAATAAAADSAGLDLRQGLARLAGHGCRTVHVEAGAVLAGALLQAGLVDELLLYLAPTLLGPGRGLAALGPLASLAAGTALEWRSVEPVGPDLRIVARVLPRTG